MNPIVYRTKYKDTTYYIWVNGGEAHFESMNNQVTGTLDLEESLTIMSRYNVFKEIT